MEAPERTAPEVLAIAAWVNCPADKLPTQMRAHTCEATMIAWQRVVKALIEYAQIGDGSLKSQIERQEARIAELEGALRWYGDKSNWPTPSLPEGFENWSDEEIETRSHELISPVEADCGQRARAALQKDE